MLLDIIPNNHIHNLKSSGVMLYVPTNDNKITHAVMREYVINSIKGAIDCPMTTWQESLQMFKQELEAARGRQIVNDLNTYRTPDDCA